MKQGESLPISNIRLDGGTQPRAAIDFEAVFDYMDAMTDGANFPPVAAPRIINGTKLSVPCDHVESDKS